MNYIFIFLILFSFLCAVVTGNIEQSVQEMLLSAQKAVELSISLIGIMAFWLGIVNIANVSGLTKPFSKLIKKPLSKLFSDLENNDEALTSISLNIGANAFGLMNAATPFGIKAMEEMQKDNKNKKIATNSMCTFLAMNTAGFQLVPAIVLAIVTTSGMENPTQIILPTLIVTTLAFISAIIYAKLLERVFK